MLNHTGKPSLCRVLPPLLCALGAHLLVHPGEDASWGRIAVAAPRCSLLKATEELGLSKADKEGNMIVFSFHDRNNFSSISK